MCDVSSKRKERACKGSSVEDLLGCSHVGPAAAGVVLGQEDQQVVRLRLQTIKTFLDVS